MISVCMATYNGSTTIKRQLMSIINQLSEDDEIIIVDDQSKDNTVEIINSIKHEYFPNITIIINKHNMGPIRSFENALRLAQGDYIFLSDQDDVWLPNKVARIKQQFLQGAQLVVHDGVVVDGNLQVIDNSWNHYNHNKLQQSLLSNIISNGYTGAMMAFSKALVRQALPFPNNIPMHDQWLYDVAKLEKMKIVIIDEPLMQYVRHGNNVTGMKKRHKLIMLKDRLALIKALLNYQFLKK